MSSDKELTQFSLIFVFSFLIPSCIIRPGPQEDPERFAVKTEVFYGRVISKYEQATGLDAKDYYLIVRFAPYEENPFGHLRAEGPSEHLRVQRSVYDKADPSKVSARDAELDPRWRYGVIVHKKNYTMPDGTTITRIGFMVLYDEKK